ncbi:tetratricopeptide repeat protein [Planctomycetota bacterium]
MDCFAHLYIVQDRYEEAETLLDKALPIARRRMRPNHPVTLDLVNARVVLYKEQEHYEEAEKLLLEAIDGLCVKLGDTHPHTIESLNNLIALHEAWNKSEEAKKWRTILQHTEAKIE